MRTINGWTDKDIQILIARTARSEDAIARFCRAVDKQLYMLLPAHIKRATLHFHLNPDLEVSEQYAMSQNMTHHNDTNTQIETENIISLKKYRSKKRRLS
jgi:hypothetical protein